MTFAHSRPQHLTRLLSLAALTLSLAAASSALEAPASRAQPRQRRPAELVPVSAVVSVAGPSARSWTLHALRRGARRLTSLRVRADVGGSASVFDGTTSPLLSADGRWLAYRVARQLRVRDLRDGSERAVPATLGSAGGGQGVAFALDSSSLLYFDYTHLEDADAFVDEGFGPTYEGFHRIFVLATGEVRDVPLDAERDQPMLLENSSDLLVVESSRGAAAGSHLVRVHYDADDERRTLLASSREMQGFGQLVGGQDRLAWITATGIVVAARDGANPQALTPQGGFAEYQRPTFGPSGAAMIFEHMQRAPSPGGGGISVHARVVHVDRASGVSTPVYDCASLCSTGFDDERSLLIHDGTTLVRVGLDRRVTRIRTGVRAVAFAGLP